MIVIHEYPKTLQEMWFFPHNRSWLMINVGWLLETKIDP